MPTVKAKPAEAEARTAEATTQTIPTGKGASTQEAGKKKGGGRNQRREIKYERFACNIYATGYPLGPLAVKHAKILIGWRTESEAIAQAMKANPKLKEEQLKWGSEYDLLDFKKEKVRLENNARNRILDLDIAKGYAQDVLNKVWAPDGPNGETIIVSTYGNVISGQKRLVGLIWAGQVWEATPHWKAIWETEPTMETFVSLGVSEKEENLRTIDNVQTRSEMDTWYTSDVLKDMEPAKRKEMAKSITFAVDLLWDRTRQSEVNKWEGRQTHATSHAFKDRHPRLMECIEHASAINAEGREINSLKLYAGEVAAMMYLMASSKSNINDYSQTDPPSEEQLTFEEWDKAEQFVTDLGNKNSPLRKLLNSVKKQVEGDKVKPGWGGHVFSKAGKGGTKEERLGVLALAWANYPDNGRMKCDAADLRLEYDFEETDEGTFAWVKPSSNPTVEGIDQGFPKRKPKDEDEEEEETQDVAERSKEMLKKVAAAKKAKAGKAGKKEEEDHEESNGEVEEAALPKKKGKEKEVPTEKLTGMAADVAKVRLKHPGSLLLFKTGVEYRAFGVDAKDVAQLLKVSFTTQSGLEVCAIPNTKIEQGISKLIQASKVICVLENVKGAGLKEIPLKDIHNQK